ncbi:MAG: hypothetical protein JST46_06930 [Bacteroidetes bacterium]|nr:hypothetical protein [Bacteroidota bacterium]
MTDEELQSRIEQGQVGNSGDDLAYDIVFRALRRESFQLPPDFAFKVLDRYREAKSNYRYDHVFLLIGLILLMVACVVAFVLTDFKPQIPALVMVSDRIGQVVFGVLIILLLQWIDRKVVRKQVQGFRSGILTPRPK